jgi:hypothetical protein
MYVEADVIGKDNKKTQATSLWMVVTLCGWLCSVLMELALEPAAYLKPQDLAT